MSLYNALAGYPLLQREEPGYGSPFPFAFALGLHFVVNEDGLREDQKGLYERTGRFALGAAVVLAGWSGCPASSSGPRWLCSSPF